MMPDLEKPDEALANYLSELLNDNAPIGWRHYLGAANCIIAKFSKHMTPEQIKEVLTP